MVAMKTLRLPKFNVPDIAEKAVTTKVYHRWLIENRLRLIKSGFFNPAGKKDNALLPGISPFKIS